MDLTGSLGSLGATLDGPCTALVGTGSQEGNQTQQSVAGLDQTVQTAFGNAQLLHKHSLLIGIIQLSDVSFQLGADGDRKLFSADLMTCRLIPDCGKSWINCMIPMPGRSSCISGWRSLILPVWKSGKAAGGV